MRCREDMTQKELSECTGIPQRHISEMENGKRPIGKKNAQKLAKALNANYKVFL
ncbi:MAG: helix-turn-helix transcriptional regulator [Deltaproteobacteria bacterium]|nr:helix-turn-helix transcriptional regulator [Deltaproteobacteria bacterium]